MIGDEVWSRLEQDIQPLRTVQKVTAQNAAMTGNQPVVGTFGVRFPETSIFTAWKEPAVAICPVCLLI